MAKKKKDKEEQALAGTGEKEGKSGNKIINLIIVLVIIIIWLAAFVLLIKLDVGGFGSRVLRPILKDVPIVNKILPAGEGEEYSDQSGASYKSLAEALARINELEAELASLRKGNSSDADYIAELAAEVERLKVFEQNQSDFKKRVREFDENVVFNNNAPSIEEYRKYYEEISPDNAAEIYRQVVEQQEYDKKVVAMADKYAKMDPAGAAEILEIMTAGDLELVCGILSNMKEAQAALIMEQLDPATAAMVTKKMTIKN